MIEYYASCPKGFEQLLAEEITTLGGEFKRETVGGIWFLGNLSVAYRVCLWSRLASKILLPLAKSSVKNDQELYELVSTIPWEDHLSPQGRLWVDFTGTNHSIRNSQFGALKVKDAIVDRMRDRCGARPSVDKDSPNLIINVRLSKGNATVSLDLTGEGLHRRGYRLRQGIAPLKENLAAALLYRSRWPEIAAADGALLDPMCGSGTILIEAALMAADMAPGLKRSSFAFEHWLNHANDVWLELRQEAFDRIKIDKIPEIRGYDFNRTVIEAAEFNIAQAGLIGKVRVIAKPLEAFVKPTHKPIDTGLVLTNPPYGERLGDLDKLIPLYKQLGTSLRDEFVGWKAGVFTGNPDAAKNMGLRSNKKYKLFNGSIEAELLLFDVNETQFVNAPAPDRILTRPSDPYKVTEGAKMLINRLAKNKKQLNKWLKKNEIECYRLYDADMPEYSAAVDIYGDHVHIQEYQAPKSVAEEKAEQRFNDIVAAVKQELQQDESKISIKQRRRNRGKQQYERLDANTEERPPVYIEESGAEFEINLWDYLDTGLFLDHRPVRLKIREMARDKKFLNLFCYTATASVHAAIGGAKETVSVDLSNTYLNWAKRNFQLNRLRSDNHRFEQGDCVQWLNHCREGFDLIMLDPPSFSNSKKTDTVLDIQRDHVDMINRCMDILLPGGVLIFSNNLRSFKLDSGLSEQYDVEDYTKKSLDPDFARNAKIHSCWFIRKK
jgi:23S rRNA (guanine2445-N2)-methyltransferase / 23S rRNA (guanine2069-N7)-methyltransferase